jgi:endonuclease/exonuclease/phosphatase family metal-dependent hydrolase
MLKILTWNIGSFSFLKYAKYFGIKYKGQKVNHEYFQPKINGNFVSSYIEKTDPDIVFLQEFYSPEDVQSIEVLKNYPHKKLISAWYHKHCILVASKQPFEITEEGSFSIVSYGGLNFIPIHLNSFSALKRFKDATILNDVAKTISNAIILGDTNIWSRGTKFLFRNDKKTYEVFTENLVDLSRQLISTTCTGFGLDKAFGSHNIKLTDIQSPKIRGYFMDHYPVSFDISLGK